MCFLYFCVISRNKVNNTEVVIDRELLSQFYDGTYEFDKTNESFTELEEGAVGGAVYDIYRMSIEQYNEIVSENNDGFGLIELRFKNVNRSLINTNMNYGKSGIGGDTILTIDSDYPPSGSDTAAGSLGVNVPIKIFMAKSVDTEVIDNTNITIDTVNTPNVIDKDIVVDTSNDQITSKIDSTNNIVKWTIPAIGESTTDLDILCLRSLTVTPLQFPYNFSIDSYNTDYNTNYIGIRNLTINSSGSSSIINIRRFSLTDTDSLNVQPSYYFSSCTKYIISTTISFNGYATIVTVKELSDEYKVMVYRRTQAGSISVYGEPNYPIYVYVLNGENLSYCYLYDDLSNNVIFRQLTTSGRSSETSLYKYKFNMVLE